MKGLIAQFKPFIKYCVVGISGTFIDIATLYILVEYAGLLVIPASIAAFLVSVTNNFVWNKIWTFRSKSTNYRKLFIKFLIVSLGGLCLTVLCMYVLAEIGGMWYIAAKLVTSAVVLSWNFLANKYWTFQSKDHRTKADEDLRYDYSLIIPAYNESERIADTLHKITTFLNAENIDAEILVVDDGSADSTAAKAAEAASSWKSLRIIELKKNQGKGNAVKVGMLEAKGRRLLFCDADNSTPIEELKNLAGVMDETDCDIVIGSRYLHKSRVKIKQSPLRIFIGRFGNFLIRFFIIDGIKDSQCGFKMFKQAVAADIFRHTKVGRWGFDIELLAIAKMRGYTVEEVPVSWFNSFDSRFRPVRDAVRTFMELIFIKLNVWCGRYDDE